MYKKLIFLIILFLSMHHFVSAAALEQKLLMLDELHGRFSRGAQTAAVIPDITRKSVEELQAGDITLESVAFILLDLYNVINHAFHYGHTNFDEDDIRKWRLGIKKLTHRAELYQNKKAAHGLTAMPAADLQIIDAVFAFTPALAKGRNFTQISILKNLYIGKTCAQTRLEFINIILRLFKDQVTQIEKSLEYHYDPMGGLAREKNADGTYKWTSNSFKAWLNQKFSTGTYNPDESLQLFQDFLINEKLHPGYCVFYHAAGLESAGFQFFNNSFARLLNAKGGSFNPRSHVVRDIGVQIAGASPGTLGIRNVSDVISHMDGTGQGDTGEPVAKHLISSSYSFFINSHLTAQRFYKDNAQYNSVGILRAIGETVAAFTTDQSLLDETSFRQNIDDQRGKYGDLLKDKFRDRDIDGHWGTQQKGYPSFSSLIQFFIKRNCVDDVVYFGGSSGARNRNSTGNSKIGEVIDAFLGIVPGKTYLQSIVSLSASVKDGEDLLAPQGKIAVTCEAFLNGINQGDIHLVFHGQRNAEFVAIDDLKSCVEAQVREDFLRVLDAPTDFTRETFAFKYKNTFLGQDLTQSYNQKIPQKTDVVALKSAKKIISEKPGITLAQLTTDLCNMLKLQPLNTSVKEKLFTEEFLTAVILQSKNKAQKISSDLVKNALKEILEDPKRDLDKNINRLGILELTSSLANAAAEDEGTFQPLLIEVVDVLSNSNGAIPVIPRVANDNEKKQEFGMLKVIAHAFLTAKEGAEGDRFRQYVITSFTQKPADPFAKHKTMCLSAIDLFVGQFISEMTSFQKILSDELMKIGQTTLAKLATVQRIQTELNEKKGRLNAPNPGDDLLNLRAQIIKLNIELNSKNLENELKRTDLEKELKEYKDTIRILTGYAAQIARFRNTSVFTETQNMLGKLYPGVDPKTGAAPEKDWSHERSSIRNYIPFIKNKLIN